MKKTGMNEEDHYLPLDAADDEIEILEVVGLDEDSPAGSVVEDEDFGEDEADDEIVLEFDDDGESGPAEVRSQGEPDGLIRLRADFDNYKKRVEREREANERQAAAGLIKRVLPVLDNFERAISAAPENPDDDRTFHDGVALIFKQLLEELRKEGLHAIDSVGEPFDPNLHDAVVAGRFPGFRPNTIVEELQRGYLLHDRVLRPSLVRVCVDIPETAANEGEET